MSVCTNPSATGNNAGMVAAHCLRHALAPASVMAFSGTSSSAPAFAGIWLKHCRVRHEAQLLLVALQQLAGDCPKCDIQPIPCGGSCGCCECFDSCWWATFGCGKLSSWHVAGEGCSFCDVALLVAFVVLNAVPGTGLVISGGDLQSVLVVRVGRVRELSSIRRWKGISKIVCQNPREWPL